jgi:hypothetical protein
LADDFEFCVDAESALATEFRAWSYLSLKCLDGAIGTDRGTGLGWGKLTVRHVGYHLLLIWVFEVPKLGVEKKSGMTLSVEWGCGIRQLD